MKKIIFASLIALAGLSLTSCSKEDSTQTKHEQQQKYMDYLVGKWKVMARKSAGNVYNCKYRIDGDYYVEFKSDKTAVCSGDATEQGYYDSGIVFPTYKVGETLGFVKWGFEYNDDQCYLWTYQTVSSAGTYRRIDFNSDGTINVWHTSTTKTYYVLKRVQ